MTNFLHGTKGAIEGKFALDKMTLANVLSRA